MEIGLPLARHQQPCFRPCTPKQPLRPRMSYESHLRSWVQMIHQWFEEPLENGLQYVLALFLVDAFRLLNHHTASRQKHEEGACNHRGPVHLSETCHR
jgi:hypothetical protein